MMNMKSFYSLIFCVLFASFAAEGQGWERIYPNIAPQYFTGVKKVLPVQGGYLLLVGNMFTIGGNAPDFQIVKISNSGEQEWSRNYDFSAYDNPVDMIPLSDGGYAILNLQYLGTSPFSLAINFLVKLDQNFDVVFVNELPLIPFGLNGYLTGKRIFEDNGVIWILGYTSGGPGDLDGFAFGFSVVDGSGISENVWGATSTRFRDALFTGGGGFLAVSDSLPVVNGMGKILFGKYGDYGNQTIWHKTLDNSDGNSTARKIIPALDGGYLIAGGHEQGGLVVKINDQGEIVWKRIFQTQQDSTNPIGIGLIVPLSDGTGYWAIGSNDDSQPQIILLRIDLQGNKLSSKILTGATSYAFDALPTLDNGCLLGGYNGWYYNGGPVLPYVAKTNSAGQTFLSGFSGSVTYDLNGDCIAETDTVFNGQNAYAIQNGVVVASSVINSQGEYYIALDTGNFQITVQRPTPGWTVCGQDTMTVTVAANDTLEGVDFILSYNPQPVDSVFGYAFHDIDGDCLRDSFETGGYEGWPVYLYVYHNGAVVFADTILTGPDGYYVFDNLPNVTNEMHANLIILGPPPGSGLLCHFVNCPQEEVFNFGGNVNYQSNIAFNCDSLPPCPLIEVDIATNVIRPCSTSVYHVNYCNIGVEAASDAYAEVTFDTGLNVTASSIPWSSVNGNTYTFELGYLTSGQCGDFNITVLASCDDPVGTTYCAEAHAFPDTCSLLPGPNWDGSQIEVTAECTGDSVIFTIQNVGAGDMLNPLEYIVIEDNVLLMQGNFDLESGEQIQVAYEANGAFFRMETDQAPGFPGLNTPIAWAEGCGSNGNVSLGFVNQFPLGDEDVWLDIFCLESVNSYDPNDKNGFPRGYADEHFIEQNVDIEYLIRFQNTGTAPAYQVEIRDTLPVAWLDPASVRPGASSHDYVWDMQGNGVVVFRFPGIVLPDSTANFDASQGFVKFRVSQHKDVPLGTKIENAAAIFFDFNPPIITNQTLHTVGKNFILTKTDGPRVPNLQVKIVPNPARDLVRVQIAGLENGDENLTFVLYSAVGQPVLNGKFSGANFEFQAGQLPEGVYFYEIRQEGKLAATGKLVRL